jgi:RsiW-degrading membrane proteinase PrsW (M82 family)
LVVYLRVFKKTIELDEPTDAMIYMIISALGFAAIENIFLLTPLFDKDFTATINIAFSRFLGATLLHVLASATIGYYLALALHKPSKTFQLLIHGFILAIILHGLYNIFIVQLEQNFAFIFPVALMIVSTIAAISIFFKKISKMGSISLMK